MKKYCSYIAILLTGLSALPSIAWSAPGTSPIPLVMKRVLVQGTSVTVPEGLGASQPFTCPVATGVCTGSSPTVVQLQKTSTGYVINRSFGAVESYASNGLILRENNSTGGLTTYSYDSSLRLIAIVAPNGARTTYSYDSSGRLSSVTSPAGVTTTYTYNPAGRLAEVATASGTKTSYTYDMQGNLLMIRTPVGSSYFVYDSSGNLVKTIDAKGVTICANPLSTSSSLSCLTTGIIINP